MSNSLYTKFFFIFLVLSCKGNESRSPVTPPGAKADTNSSNTDANSSKTDTTSSSPDDESTVAPSTVTGTFLACDYVEKPSIIAAEAKIGCRMADNKTGHKTDMTKLSAYEWGFDELTSVNVDMTKATNSLDPWQVTFKLTGDFFALQTIGEKFKVGLKEKSTAKAYYQKIDDLVGKLNFMMEGTWKSNICLAYNNNLYYMRTDTMKSGDYSTLMEYYVNSQCVGSPDWTEIIKGLITKASFDGYKFYIDAKTNSYVYLPKTENAIPMLSGACPSLTFQVGVATDGMSCNIITMEYTTMKFDEDLEHIYTAVANSFYDGMTEERRKQQIVADWYLIKQ